MSEADTGQGREKVTPGKLVAMCIRFVLWVLLSTAILFGLAGRLDLPAFWGVWGLWTIYGAVELATVLRKDPSLLKERARPGPGGKDPYLRIFAAVLFTAHWIVASLDVGRYHWSGSVPLVVQVAGFVGLAAALALVNWSMAVNRFFSSEARIQRDRGHHLITDGPYRFIRHPGYLAGILMNVCSPLALDSLYSGIPTAVLIFLFVRRLLIEDRLLRAELEGFSD